MVVQNIEQERISRLEGTYEQVDRRLGETNRSIEGLQVEMNSRFEEMNNRYNTLVMLMIASWVTVIALYFK